MHAQTIRTSARRGHVILVAASLLLAGCTGYQLEPLAASHPAHPEATAAPERPPSQTLAYTRSDIPSVQSVPAMAAAQQGEHQARQTGEGFSQTVVGEGEVISTVPKASQIVLEHGQIKDFMEAMTMGYRIDPPSLLEGLKPGDKVRFTIDLPKRTITQIEKLR
jgi:Cu(I)/Ag(I) efflux system periplasmic protein CusF